MPKDLKLRSLANKKILEKPKDWVRNSLAPILPPHKQKQWQKPIKLHKISSTPYGKLVSKHLVKNCPRKQNSQNPLFNSAQTLWNPLQILVHLKPFTLLKFILKVTEMWQVATFYIFRKVLPCTLYSSTDLGSTQFSRQPLTKKLKWGNELKKMS